MTDSPGLLHLQLVLPSWVAHPDFPKRYLLSLNVRSSTRQRNASSSNITNMDPGERVEESTMETPAETYERLADDTWKAVRYLKQCKFRVLACLVVEQSLRDNAPVKSSAKCGYSNVQATWMLANMVNDV